MKKFLMHDPKAKHEIKLNFVVSNNYIRVSCQCGAWVAEVHPTEGPEAALAPYREHVKEAEENEASK